MIVLKPLVLAGLLLAVVLNPTNAAAQFQADETPGTADSASELTGGPAISSLHIGSLTVPDGCRFEPDAHSICNINGVLTGPSGQAVHCSIWTPVFEDDDDDSKPRLSNQYVRKNGTLARFPDHCKVRKVNGHILELAVKDKQLAASYPDRGIDLSASFESPEQREEVLKIIYSIALTVEEVSWDRAKLVLEKKTINRIFQNDLDVRIETADGPVYQTQQPRFGDCIACLKLNERHPSFTLQFPPVSSATGR